MKNQAVFQTNIVSESLNAIAEKVQSLSFAQLMLVVRQWILSTRPFVALSQLFSLVLDEKVSALKAFNLLHAMVAFLAMVLLGGNSILLQLALVAWCGITAWQCKRDGWGNEGKK